MSYTAAVTLIYVYIILYLYLSEVCFLLNKAIYTSTHFYIFLMPVLIQGRDNVKISHGMLCMIKVSSSSFTQTAILHLVTNQCELLSQKQAQ